MPHYLPPTPTPPPPPLPTPCPQVHDINSNHVGLNFGWWDDSTSAGWQVAESSTSMNAEPFVGRFFGMLQSRRVWVEYDADIQVRGREGDGEGEGAVVQEQNARLMCQSEGGQHVAVCTWGQRGEQVVG